MMKVYSITTIMDLSYPGQRTATATSCIHTILYTCQDHVLESLILDSKYSKMTLKFVKQKSH